MSAIARFHNDIGYVEIVYRSLITEADVRALTFQDWLLLIAGIRFVVIDCMRNTECIRRVSLANRVLLHVQTMISVMLRFPNFLSGCAWY